MQNLVQGENKGLGIITTHQKGFGAKRSKKKKKKNMKKIYFSFNK